MAKRPEDLISDAEIERVHGNANFGSMSKRRVVDEGVLKYAFGYTSGSTQLAILREHKLLRAPQPGSYASTLTKKGFRYLRALKGDYPIANLLVLFKGGRLSQGDVDGR